MSAAEILEQIRGLPHKERLEVTEQILEEFGCFDDDLSSEQIEEMEPRAEDALAHPERCRPLEDALADIEKRFRSKR